MDLFTQIAIEVMLTEKGLKNYEKVCEIVIQFVRNIQGAGISKELYEDISKIKAMKFKYKDKENPMNYVN